MKTTIKLIGITDLVAVIGRHGCRCKNALAGVFAKQKLLTLLLAGMLIVMSSCGDDNSTSGDPDLSGTIAITPSTATVGATLTANYSGGSETVTYQWKRGSTNLGTAVTQLASEAGSYTVTVSATGYKSKTSAAVNVTEDTSGQLRLSNLPVTFQDETDETDFLNWLSDYITGTPKVQVTGTGVGRRLTIELDAPKESALSPLSDFWSSDGNYAVVPYKGSDSFCVLAYIDRDVNLNGQGTYNSYIYRYNNLSLTKGWHFLYATRVLETEPENNHVYIIQTSKTTPTGYTWTVWED